MNLEEKRRPAGSLARGSSNRTPATFLDRPIFSFVGGHLLAEMMLS
jgi:hypothetical protein